MTTALPPEVESAADRITLPVERPLALPDAVTGELRRLLAWWQSLGDGTPPRECVVEPGMGDVPDVSGALLAGLAAADAAVDAGANVVIPRVADRDDSAARALVAALTRTDAPAVVPQGEGMSDAAWMAKVAGIRDLSFALAPLRGEPATLLALLTANSMAFVVGALLGAAARQTPCIIDGTDELAAAVVADRVSARAKAWWICGSQSTDPARHAAAERVDLSPGLPLALSDDDGLGAEATLALLRLLTSTG